MRITELLEQADIFEYISQYVELEKRGNEYWGLSPFQAEKTPSFSVNAEKQVWKDFSSGKGGNIIDFIVNYDNCTVGEAIRKLLAWLDIPPGEYTPRLETVKYMRKYRRRRNGLTPLPPKAELPQSALDKYLKTLIKLWNDEGISQEICDEFEIRYDPYEEAIIIPIRDNDGRLVNICRRTTDPNYKLFGIPKYIYKYPMGQIDFLYGWYKSQEEILQKKEVIIVEGAKSVMKLYQYGYRNAVAALTSHLNEHQLLPLIKAGCDVVIAFGKDAKPYNDNNIKRLRRFCQLYCVLDKTGLLGEKDAPVDKGKEVWIQLYENRVKLR